MPLFRSESDSVEQRPEPLQIGAIGNIQPYATVSVKSEVGGELTGVHFTEGQEVRKGQLLFTIDPRPFEAALKLAQANRAKNLAQAANAQADADRYKGLVSEGVIARQQYDQARANADALKAAVEADEAAIETARLQLSYARIYSPVDGRTGNLLVHEGNLVKENDVPLVVINQIQPIYASFAVPAQHLPDITRYRAQHPLRVEASPKGSNQGGAEGVLTFIDNNVDTATGTIQLKATFPNRDRSLWPGEFVDVNLTLATQPNAIVVPTQAIQTGQEGQFVFVVKPDMTVESRPVVVDRTRGRLRGRLPGAAARGDRGDRRPVAARAGQPHHRRRRGAGLVSIAGFFIRRPVMTTLVMLGILIFGAMAYRLLPVSDLPNVDFPTIKVTARLPGASPETMASSVATPLEKEFSTIAGLDTMSSTSTLGCTSITLQFALNRSLDAAAQDVQAAISRASRQLPPDMPSPPTYNKVNPADSPILYMALTSPTLPLSTVDEYGETTMAQRISMVSGVAQVQVFGAQKYAVRVQLDPNALASRGIGIDEVRQAIQNANVNLPTGTLYGAHQAFTLQATGQLEDAAGLPPRHRRLSQRLARAPG